RTLWLFLLRIFRMLLTSAKLGDLLFEIGFVRLLSLEFLIELRRPRSLFRELLLKLLGSLLPSSSHPVELAVKVQDSNTKDSTDYQQQTRCHQRAGRKSALSRQESEHRGERTWTRWR